MTGLNPRGDFELRLVENVRKHGCQVNSIFAEDEKPGFSYSIGFVETVDQPEIIAFGLPIEVMHEMINLTLSFCRDGLELVDWCRVDGLLQSHSCIVRAIPEHRIVREYFNSAIWYHEGMTGRPLSRAVQLVWPGAVDGLFPWDEGCAQEVVALQTPLYRRLLDA